MEPLSIAGLGVFLKASFLFLAPPEWLMKISGNIFLGPLAAGEKFLVHSVAMMTKARGVLLSMDGDGAAAGRDNPPFRAFRSSALRGHKADYTLLSSRGKLLRDWVFVPLGIFAILGACYGVDALFRRVSVSFPASVACLALLFVGLLLCEAVLGTHVTRRAVGVISVPVRILHRLSWILKAWLPVLFANHGLGCVGGLESEMDRAVLYAVVCDDPAEPGDWGR
ncbi:hypothetical protein VCV18_006954 [Metarhizium anisopliae]